MALFQGQYKHYCRICKKGFGCGRALGGHMRAHGIGGDDRAHGIVGDHRAHVDDDGNDEDDDDDDGHASDWERSNVAPPSINKRMYALRTNPNRLKSCRACENGKCTSDDVESFVSSPESDDDGGDYQDGIIARREYSNNNWSKRKRSFRSSGSKVAVGDFLNCPSREEEDLAKCLMMLSNANADANVDHSMMVEPEESCASASKEEERFRNYSLSFVPPRDGNGYSGKGAIMEKAKGVANLKGGFECKACKKVFNSHQALGGHRASHKKVKGCFAARFDQENLVEEDHDVIMHEEFFQTKSTSALPQFNHGPIASAPTPAMLVGSSSKRKSKVHECSICHRVFSSGQALGGHKRCHWITTSNSPETSKFSHHQFHQQEFHDHLQQTIQNNMFKDSDSESLDLTLDLNLPASQHVKSLSCELSAEYFLQPLSGEAKLGRDDNNLHNINSNGNNSKKDEENCEIAALKLINADDEADSKVKLSELKDMNMKMNGRSPSPWLQVGIVPTTDEQGTKYTRDQFNHLLHGIIYGTYICYCFRIVMEAVLTIAQKTKEESKI